MSAFQDSRLLVAAGKIDTTGAKLSGVGNFTPARSGAGVYTLTLPAPGVPEGEELLIAVNNTAAGQIQIVSTSALVKTVTTFAADGTTATDKKFSFEIYSFLPGA